MRVGRRTGMNTDVSTDLTVSVGSRSSTGVTKYTPTTTLTGIGM